MKRKMARRKRPAKKRARSRKGLLGNLPATMKVTGMNRQQLIGIGLAAVVGTVAGIAIGTPQSLIGTGGLIGLGAWKKNPYLISAGAGMLVATGFRSRSEGAIMGLEGGYIDGLSIDAAKARVGNFFSNFKESLSLSSSIDGLSGEDEVNYFVNPYNAIQGTGELDLSRLDQISEQVAEMNGLADYDAADMNF